MNIPRRDGHWKFQEVPDEQVRRPDTWGADRLTEFLEAALNNTYLMVNAHKAEVKRVRTGLELFTAGSDAYFSRRRMHAVNDSRYVALDITFPFLMATLQSLYAATTLTFSGQQNEAAKPLRGAIETALYAYHFHRAPNALDIWASRPVATALRDPKQADAARKQRSKAGAEFSAVRIVKEMMDDDPKLAGAVYDLYEDMIDEGGHFNIPVFRAHARFTRLANPERRRVDYRVIGATGAERKRALRTLALTTSHALRIFQLLYREFWQSSGVSDQLLAFTRSIK
jgi:hypothetical protein